MKKLLAPVLGLVVAAPAHAIPIVSLHGSNPCSIQIASTMVDGTLLIASIAALAAAVAFRVLRRQVVQQRQSNNP